MTTTFDGLRETLVEDYELAPERLTPATRLTDIELDSLALVELIFSLEDRFDVKAEDDGTKFETLGDVAAYIDRLIGEREAAQTASTTASAKKSR